MKRYMLIVGLVVMNLACGAYLYCMQANKTLIGYATRGEMICSFEELQLAFNGVKPMQSIQYQDIFPENTDSFTDIQGFFCISKKVKNKINEILKKRSVLWLAMQKILEMKGLESQEDVHSQVDVLNKLLTYPFDVNERNYFFTFKKNMFGLKWVEMHEGSLLHMIALCGNKELICKFLAKKPELNVQNNEGLPPIFFSVVQDDEATTRLLVEAGAKIDFRVVKKPWMGCGKPKITTLSAWTKNMNLRQYLLTRD